MKIVDMFFWRSISSKMATFLSSAESEGKDFYFWKINFKNDTTFLIYGQNAFFF